ncbi:MAG: hypothetical protein AB7K52_15150 [Phycisphaerales bacterium]
MGNVRVAMAVALGAGITGLAAAQAPIGAFVNWESPHVHPMDLTPDRTRLLAVNTADARLEVFAVSSGGDLVRIGSVPVGLDPVSVRARSNNEAWVVNHVSDSVSVVDLDTLRVRATLGTKDEPCDVVFAGAAGRAFVSCQTTREVLVFDPANLAAAPASVSILGESPRALAVSPDGSTVFCAVFESGNKTTILGGGGIMGGALAFPPNVVSDPLGPYGGVNPPPNAGMSFEPARSAAGSVNMPVGLIVRKNDAGAWKDDNNGDWTDLVSGANASRSGRPVGWDLYDHDVAMINADALGVTYIPGLMNMCMALSVHPVSGRVTLVGTAASNEVRFEPNVKGTFIRVQLASVHPMTPAAPDIVDLNAHLDYAEATIPQAQRDLALGDPRAIEWEPGGLIGYVTGLGSNNLIIIDENGSRVGGSAPIEVGEGPTGLALHGPSGRVFVLNRFGASVSIVNPTVREEVSRVGFHDATPTVIRTGRKHLYDTHKNSGLGHISCASCHVDARNDRLAWDLGDPSGGSDPLTGRNLGFGIPGLAPPFAQPAFQPFHPMKGPMTTQTLQAIIGLEPFHWRGDRLGIEEFNGAFIGLQGDDANLTPAEMQEFENFLASITLPPNPFRNFDNSLPTSLPLPGHFTTGRFGAAGLPLPDGNAVNGMNVYRSTARRIDGGALACVTCHTLPTGAGPDSTWNGAQHVPIAPGPMGERHLGLVSVDGSSNVSIKVPHTRTIYKKTGFNTTQARNTTGYGVLHDGSVDSIERFVSEPAFNVQSNQEVADLVAFMLSFSGSDLAPGVVSNVLVPPGPASKDTRASVGVQLTLAGPPSAAESTRLTQMLGQANLNRVGLIAKGRWNAEDRGAYYTGSGTWQTDRAGQQIAHADLLATAAANQELTLTVVALGTQVRLGANRDSDGFLDADELDVCADPADPANYPGAPGSIDFNADLNIDADDLGDFINCYFSVPPCDLADVNADLSVDPDDLGDYINLFFSGCP